MDCASSIRWLKTPSSPFWAIAISWFKILLAVLFCFKKKLFNFTHNKISFFSTTSFTSKISLSTSPLTFEYYSILFWTSLFIDFRNNKIFCYYFDNLGILPFANTFILMYQKTYGCLSNQNSYILSKILSKFYRSSSNSFNLLLVAKWFESFGVVESLRELLLLWLCGDLQRLIELLCLLIFFLPLIIIV